MGGRHTAMRLVVNIVGCCRAERDGLGGMCCPKSLHLADPLECGQLGHVFETPLDCVTLCAREEEQSRAVR